MRRHDRRRIICDQVLPHVTKRGPFRCQWAATMPKRPTPATAAGCDREAAVNSILAFLDSLEVAVVLIRGKGRRAKVKVPRKPAVRDQEASCRDDLLAVLREA